MMYLTGARVQVLGVLLGQGGANLWVMQTSAAADIAKTGAPD